MFDNWYVVQVRTGKEEEIVKKCQFYIDHDILIDCFIPITKKKKKYHGTWHIVDDILFKGYIFIITNQVEQLYTQLKKVPDLTKLLGNDGKEIYPIYPQEAMFLTKFSNKDHVVDISNGIIENDKIIINEGPLIGLEGLITKIDRHKRIAYVDVELLGKLTRVQGGLENIPFSPPDMSEDEINEVADTLRNGWITTGPKVKEFERQIAEFVGVNKAVCLNSQTACAEMALRVLGVGEGDEVIVPAYTYTASASVVCHVGAKLVLVDVQKDNLKMDYDALEKAITEKTKVIIPVDLGGVPCDYDRIYEIIEKKKHLFKPSNKIQEAMGRISVNADTAHAFGASWHGKMCGSIADFSSFSFHAVKNLTTAEGGALTWRSIEGIDDEEIYKELQLLSLHGQSKDALAKTKLGAWEYDVVAPLYKCNMTDIMGGIGLAQMRRYPGMLKRRKEIIERYNEAFKPLGIEVLNHYDENHQSSGHLYITRVPNITGDQRNEIIIKMAERGIACNVHYKPLPMLSAYKNLGFDIKDYPNAYNRFINEITLPLHTKLSDEDVDYIIENFKEIVSCL